MEEYLANMRTLRCYMNDLEEEAAKRSAEEQRQRTAIDAHDSDIALVRAQAKQVSDEAEHLAKARAHVCVEMAEKQGRIASLEVVGATLKQTLDLLQLEITSTSAKLGQKRLFYTKTIETLSVKLQEHQGWLDSDNNKMVAIEPFAVEAPMNKQNFFEGKRYEVLNLGGSIDKESDVGKKLLDIKAKGSQLLLEISECKQTLEQESDVTASFPPVACRLQYRRWIRSPWRKDTKLYKVMELEKPSTSSLLKNESLK
ncbi:uncharacterized protein LOC119337155 isoform X2 [Triticum dicoccoides]|uniref:uncharacterized protein LOC119337155 isoform X2 n=1 Tax=Triticum dicoccoides TaxID=85692 RepID=UPI0018910341|nr:uncharacterized protein LOC119337155 isoform X2 [Triticum dicoccoides]